MRKKLPILVTLAAFSTSCSCEGDEARSEDDEAEHEESSANDRETLERTTRGGDVNATADLDLLRGRLRGRLAARVERVPGGNVERPAGEHWAEVQRFTASCGLLTLSTEESLARAPEDLDAAVTAEESGADRTTAIEVMHDARAPLRVVRVLSHDDVEVEGRFYAAKLYVAMADASIVEVGLECEENAMAAAEWDALTKPLVASLVAGSRRPGFSAGSRSVRLGDAEITLAVPEGWGVIGRRDEDETAFMVTEIVELGRPPAVLSIVASSSCEDDPQGRALADANGVEGPLTRVDGRIAGNAIQWFADANQRTCFQRVRRSATSCLDWSIEAPDAAGVTTARRIAETATVR